MFGKPTVFNGRINVAHPDIDPAQELDPFYHGASTLLQYYGKDEAYQPEFSCAGKADEKSFSGFAEGEF